MYGQEIEPTLQNADRTIDMTLTRIATGPTDSGRQQAASGTHIGGLGRRHIKDIAIPAELAAKLTAKPKVKEVCEALSTVGLMSTLHLTTHLKATITELQNKLTAQLDSTEAQQLPDLIQQITTRAQQ